MSGEQPVNGEEQVGLVPVSGEELDSAGPEILAPPPPPEIGAEVPGEPEVVPLLPRKRKGAARVVTVVSGKAGAGKSTIVANLAAALARDHGLATAVMDLDLQFGDQALMFDAASTPSIIDVLASFDSLTPDFVLDCMHQGAGVRVMGAPPSPELADLINTEHIREVVAQLRQIFDVVVLDTSSHLSDVALEAIDSGDVMVVVTTPYLASVKNTKLLLKTMSDLGVPARKLIAVLNRMEPGLKMPLDVLEANLKFPISLELPHTPVALVESVTDGVPLTLTKPSVEWSQKITALSGMVLAEETAETKKPARRGFLGLAR